MSIKGHESVPKHVSLKELSAIAGFGQASMLKTVKRRGFKPFQISSGSNKPYYLTAEDAEKFLRKINFEKENSLSGVINEVPQTGGVYCIEVPSYDGKTRIKIGWSDNFKDRIATYRTIVPDLRVLALWHTNDRWTERMAQKRALQLGPKIHTELYIFDDNERALEAIKEIFRQLGIPCTQNPPA